MRLQKYNIAQLNVIKKELIDAIEKHKKLGSYSSNKMIHNTQLLQMQTKLHDIEITIDNLSKSNK